MSLCKYKDIFGKPREGAHSFRIFDIAIVDLAMTVLGAYLVSKSAKINFFKTLAFLIILGIFMHWLFCVDTKLNQILLQDLPKIFS